MMNKTNKNCYNFSGLQMGNSPNKNDLESLHKNWVTASQP